MSAAQSQATPAARAAVFLDRDDTILDTTPATQDLAVPGDLYDIARVRLLPGAGESLARLQQAGYTLVLYTNQGGIARGSGTIADFEAVNDRMRDLLAPFGVKLAGVYACPYHPKGTVPRFTSEHPWRKPAPGMLTTAAAELQLDLTRCWAIGDKPRDIQAATAAGIPRDRCFLLATTGEANPDAPTIVEAATRILS